MSRASVGSFADTPPRAPPPSQSKRKREAGDQEASHSLVASSSVAESLSQKLKHPPTSQKGFDNNTAAGNKAADKIALSPEDDDLHTGDSGDLLNGVGSASSLASTVSSVFSSGNPSAMFSYPGTTPSLHALTPLTNNDSSPPGKVPSPRPAKIQKVHTHADVATPNGAPPIDGAQNASEAITPLHTPPQGRKQARKEPGEISGEKTVYDPELDDKLPQKDRRKHKPRTRAFVEQPADTPPVKDPRLAIGGYESGLYQQGRMSKAKVRMAPYPLKPYSFDPRISIGPGPAVQVCVTGFDPFVPEAQLRALFGSYGEIAEVSNKVDPGTGTYLGICLVKYRDTRQMRGGITMTAAASAKKAEKEGNGQKIGLCKVKVERDREGRKCKRAVEAIVKRNRAEQEKHRPVVTPRKVEAPPTPTTAATPAPPPNAPKGPSGKGMAPPSGPRSNLKPIHSAQSRVETEPILKQIQRKPYIFLAHCYVPVLGTTIPHLEKRMRMYKWKEVRCDRTGYYIVFDDSKFGEDEAARCYHENNMQPLFTYVMNMECQQYGNPNYERSPSPERVLAEKRQQEERERIQKEEELDWEEEKKQRAANLDPVHAALDLLTTELVEKIMSDIKTKIAAPALYDYLAPEHHIAKRRKLNIPDPSERENKRPTLPFGRADDSPASTPDSRAHGFSGYQRKPLSTYELTIARKRKAAPVARPSNAFVDERRKKAPPPRRTRIQPLHRQLQNYYDEDSEDERATSFTRESEEQDSRPLSRLSSVGFDHDEAAGTPRKKRRRTEHEAGWGAESDDDSNDETARRLLPHLINKEPEDMADRELEQVVITLPRSSSKYKRARTEMKQRKKLRDFDRLFGIKTDEPAVDDYVESVRPTVDTTPDMEDKAIETVETADDLPVAATKPKPKPKAKRKTKKQIEEEKRTALLRVEPAAEVPAVVDEVSLDDELRALIEEPSEEKAEPRSEVEWGVSANKPRKTVEDHPDLVLDLDGWQDLVKDEEDLRFLREALANERPAALGDVKLWAWKQKQIKLLNNGGIEGPSHVESKIQGYYVPNPSGCARTEGEKKISQVEKSKYLPHRLKVQKAREEREARAGNDAAPATESSKLVPATGNSRANRANNRRLVNDINIQKGLAAGTEGDAMRFNQLKKRKKLVKFDRSAIHNWGLYAEENIAANDMIIEYVGERVRQRVADLREEMYDRQGVGSSYLFRIDEDTVVDATKKGGIARFINHSCMPNCTAKIIKVDGTKRIVIYADQAIAKHEELTYDYKFDREMNSDDRIPCLCGTVACKGFLN
ncbi:histone methyltransferase set1 [Coniosporium apollinis]|uniref:Histone-lysine N-methyltransferase, H3 lysine-4 specific n=1 Tax=Coniosporium apollinis TaxID=61459 RepID=A0ABQ9P7I5_9PEZI|nr:histone methyltransferase set1 [Coniosporium apollinis]